MPDAFPDGSDSRNHRDVLDKPFSDLSAMRPRPEENSRLQSILNPARFNPVDAADSAVCYRIAWDVMLSQCHRGESLRFQPYRLEKSLCGRKAVDH